jgi:hypothetical protein
LGAARSSRMVGWAMNNSHAQKKECHFPLNEKLSKTSSLDG